MIILVAGQKGGVGKTTIAVNLATMRTLAGKDVLLLDIDPQMTSTLWASVRDQNGISPRVNSIQKYLDPIEISNPGIVTRNEIKALKNKHDDIIIDAGGIINETLRAAMLQADKIIFPLKPDYFDMWTFKKINKLVGELGDDLVGYVVLNLIKATVKGKVELADELLKNCPHLKRFETILYDRNGINNANGDGQAVFEYKTPKDAKAVSEFEQLYKEVFND